MHNGNVITELLGFVHVMRGQHDGCGLLIELTNAVPDEQVDVHDVSASSCVLCISPSLFKQFVRLYTLVACK